MSNNRIKIIVGTPSNGGGLVSSVNGEQGDVVLDGNDIELNEGGGVTVTQKVNELANNNTGTNTGDETTSSIQSKRPLKTVNGESLEGSGDIVTPNTEYTDAEIKTKYENNPDTNAFTDAEKSNLSNQSGTNTGDQDISGITTNANDIQDLQNQVSNKADQTALDNHINDTNNPHSTNANDVGLGNVNNTSDADKPISNATQTALDEKISISTVATDTVKGGLYFKDDPASSTLIISPNPIP